MTMFVEATGSMSGLKMPPPWEEKASVKRERESLRKLS